MTALAPIRLLCWVFALACLTLPLRSQPSAVVIGIADFQDPHITDLAYADDDARAFADYLQDPTEGQVPADRVRLLTDSSATLAAIQSALAWQLTVAAADEPTYLYVATHGDVEASQASQSGYLLAHDTPRNNYDLLALSVDYLNAHLAALSARGALPVLVTDACHAGTLAGNAVAGKELTTTLLMQRQQDEVRILSCQPYELSREGPQWGGGRGAFSYYLVSGMQGAADEDRDRQIDLYELERFVQERVSADTDREQHPELSGGRKDLVLLHLPAGDQQQYIEARTVALEQRLEEAVLALAPPEAQRDYVRFRRAVDAGALLEPGERSALTYYRRLRSEPALLALRGLLDDRMTVPLLDSVQQALVAYLDSDPQELAARERIDDKYRIFPRYLAAAAGILGPDDPRIPGIRAKEAYFQGLILRLETDRLGGVDTSYRRALTYLTEATDLEPEAAYHHNELGLLHLRLGGMRDAYGSFYRATQLAPTWALPYSNLGILLKQLNPKTNFQQAAQYFDRATTLKPDLASAYMNFGNLLLVSGRRDSAELLLRQALALHPDDTYIRYNLAYLLGQDSSRLDTALALFAAVIQDDRDAPTQLAKNHYESGRIHALRGDIEAAEDQLRQAIALDPADPRAYARLREALVAADEAQRATIYYTELITTRPDQPHGYLHLALLDTTATEWLRRLRTASLPDSVATDLATRLGFSFYWSGHYSQAEAALRLAISDKDSYTARFNLSAFLAATGQQKKALAAVRDTLRVSSDGPMLTTYCERYASDVDFAQLRATEGFRKLTEKYCGQVPAPD
ncbi:hypothetical protein LEM8419_00422 [Neolewinella maritima]|uniref:Peptidase C14 caspase domain-containing protein n=1 Tax=Neolewinella maritima TaxID=1383882 RepID=A0ABM9AXG0_9BACT|nr:tetratricopeptide repeat protein [Neolewinella maritima]CAH0999126.1 hypothetical protein LEM8419_00422 [Neolewinella maritima]